MKNPIVIGGVAGLILGLIEKFALNGGIDMIILTTVLGLLIGFLTTKSLKIPLLLLSVIAGAVFFIVIAAQSGLWLDDIITGGITGGVIGLIMRFLPKG